MSIVSQGLVCMPSQCSLLSPGIVLVPIHIPVPSLVVEVFVCLFLFFWTFLSLLFLSPRWNGIDSTSVQKQRLIVVAPPKRICLCSLREIKEESLWKVIVPPSVAAILLSPRIS